MVRKKAKNKIEKLISFIKMNWQKAVFWLLGLIIGLVLTKACNVIWPDMPVVVKEHTDTINVIHSIRPLPVDSDSVIRKQIENQLMKIDLLNKYEEQIVGKGDVAKTKSSANTAVCKVIVKNPYPNSRGYSTESVSSFCFIDLTYSGPFIDIKYDFFRDDYIDLVNTLCVKIFYVNNKDGRSYIVSDVNYEPRKGKNGLLVRMVNDLPSGKYTIEAGFILKENRLDKYPAFYRQTFTLKK